MDAVLKRQVGYHGATNCGFFATVLRATLVTTFVVAIAVELRGASFRTRNFIVRAASRELAESGREGGQNHIATTWRKNG